MNEGRKSTTKALFENLVKLYKQGQLLLMDTDKFMGEYGWEPTSTYAPYEFSYSLNTPEKWYTRWVARYYVPTTFNDKDSSIDRILFVSIHFTSDQNTQVDEPLISAGRLIYQEPMTLKTAKKSYHNWMCKYWFLGGSDHETRKGWRQGGQSRFFRNLVGNETFVKPLYSITSSKKLKELVIEPLMAAQEEDKRQ